MDGVTLLRTLFCLSRFPYERCDGDTVSTSVLQKRELKLTVSVGSHRKRWISPTKQCESEPASYLHALPLSRDYISVLQGGVFEVGVLFCLAVRKSLTNSG